MKPRWPDWQPTDEQMEDWVAWLSPFDWGPAKNAVREHIGSQGRFNKCPNPTQLRALLVKFHSTQADKPKGPPDPTIFVVYEGGGRGALKPGYFFPIIVLPHEQHLIMKAAENARAKREGAIGGEWKVYSESTHQAMVDMRNEIRAAIIDGGR